MNIKLELTAYIGALLILSVLTIQEGQRRTQLLAQTPLTAQDLYKRLSQSQTKLQIIDIRVDKASFEDAHVPGAIPLLNCDFSSTEESIKKNIYTYAPTILVSGDGNSQSFKDCAKHFTQARNLAGGMSAWSDESLPEDSSEYTPPKLSGGGGCL